MTDQPPATPDAIERCACGAERVRDATYCSACGRNLQGGRRRGPLETIVAVVAWLAATAALATGYFGGSGGPGAAALDQGTAIPVQAPTSSGAGSGSAPASGATTLVTGTILSAEPQGSAYLLLTLRDESGMERQIWCSSGKTTVHESSAQVPWSTLAAGGRITAAGERIEQEGSEMLAAARIDILPPSGPGTAPIQGTPAPPAATAASPTVGLAASLQGRRIEARLFNGDDALELQLNGNSAMTAGYQVDTGWRDLTSLCRPGGNRLVFTAWNGGGGYTWGLEVRVDGVVALRDVEGLAGSHGARNDDSSLGEVHRREFTFTRDDSALPVPSDTDQRPGLLCKVHVAGGGWADWASTGDVAGAARQGPQVEAIRLLLTDAPPGVGVSYRAHTANIGWMDWVTSDAVAGTTGESRRLEAIQLRLVNAPPIWHCRYRAYVHDRGWLDWVEDGEVAGTVGESRPCYAFQFEIVRR